MVREADPDAVVLDILDSVSSTVKWFREHTEPDLAFFDIQLADGISFEVFDQVEVNCPVIFTTAYDQYAVKAFKVNSIDYLLKPVKKEELAAAMKKFHKVTGKTVPVPDYSRISALGQADHLKRLVVKIGQQIKALEVKDIAYFYIDQKIVFAKTRQGDRYPVDFSLEQLDEELDPDRFFRINRGVIVSFDAISKMVIYSKSRIKVVLDPPCEIETVSSTERSPFFREWLKGK